MNVYISADMEGISGVVHGAQTEPDAREYDRACALMLGEVNAAVEGALAAGAARVVVNDSHWNMRNLRIEELHPAAELISGSPKPFSMVQGLDASFDAALFVGYHAMSGTSPASIDHTYTDAIHHVWLNGREVGEIGINAAFAGFHGVPVALVTGDQLATAEARALLGEVATVQVKEAYSRSAARCLPVAEARRLVREGARAALAQRRGPLRFDAPYALKVEFVNTGQAEMAALMPGSERLDHRVVQYSHTSYVEVYRAWRVFYNLAGVA